MHRPIPALLTVIAGVILSGCGVGNDIPILVDPAIVATERTDTTITIAFTPAANEPRVGRGFEYRVYAAANALITESDLIDLEPAVVGSTDELGDAPAVAVIGSLTAGSGYHINVAAVNTRSGDLELYDDTVAVTSGGLTVTDTYAGSDPYFHHAVSPSATMTAVGYTLDLGAASSDVYLVFSNPGTAPVSRPEVISGTLEDANLQTLTGEGAQLVPGSAARMATAAPAATGTVIIRDRPETLGWTPPAVLPSRSIVAPPPAPNYDTVGESIDFYDDSTTNTIEATCRFADTRDGITLNIWVQDGEWTTSPVATGGLVNQEMVDFLANSFLSVGADNDIHDWLTAIYGNEWGPPPAGKEYLIPDDNSITILLWDIGQDGPGGVVGYFWAKDNYRSTAITYSNQRVMFYLDSASLAEPDGAAWNPTDSWPEEMVVTLAHEFQHMIHYYQREVLKDASTPTWINEMMSQVSEDLVGRKLFEDGAQSLDIAGPRGIPPSDGGDAGSAGIDLGRLPLYNSNPSISLSTWLAGNDALKSYSISYSFGAWLARAYGGAPLFAKLMESSASDPSVMLPWAVTQAGGASLTFADLLWQWGVSVLLSDDTTVPVEVRTNSGDWDVTTIIDPGIDYSLGSINFFNYVRDGLSGNGPVIHSAGTYDLTGMAGTSLIFYQLATAATGTVDAVLVVPGGTDYTVVVK